MVLGVGSVPRQCEQAPQVANSMLVLDWDNTMAQELLKIAGLLVVGVYFGVYFRYVLFLWILKCFFAPDVFFTLFCW